MSYGTCLQIKTFLDKTMGMQDAGNNCGMTSMSSHKLLLATLGPAGTSPPPAGDTEPPKVTILAPSSGSTVTSPVTVKASISDNSGQVERAELIAGGKIVASATSAPYELTAALGPGTHTLTVAGFDPAGNKGTTSVTATVEPPPPAADTEAPRVTILAPAGGEQVSPPLTVRADISDNSGVVVKAELVIGGKVLATRSAAPFDFEVMLDPGAQVLTVNGFDAAGNMGFASVAVTVSGGETPAKPAPAAGSFGA